VSDRRATLRDVAAHAGVSPRTVSNVVNDFIHVSPTTRAKVQDSVDALDYRPNLLARGLRQGPTGFLTLLVPQLAVPYFAELAHEVVECARETGAFVMVDETGGDPERERVLLDTAAEARWIDGVLLSSVGLTESDLAGLGSRMTVVLLGERTAGSALDHVGIDNVAAATDAVTHLVHGGRTRIVALGGDGDPLDITSRLRLEGHTRALGAAGLSRAGGHARTPDYSRESGRVAVHALMERSDPPDALFCFSDDLAVGAVRGLSERGVRVPEDVAVVGFDDAGTSAYLTPGLTSIRPDRAAIARGALDILTARISGQHGPPRDLSVPYELIVRESSRPPG
jgi:LacI family transcriptional regulator, repressor for deo operon, udp, cdd, tsx, nupC, and nupG